MSHRRLHVAGWILVLCAVGCVREVSQDAKRPIGGGCDGCEIMFDGMPATLDWRTTVAGESEPGEPLEIHGTIYQNDGKTPAPEVILYVYQTDARGLYAPAEGQVQGRRHGRLRGWMKTDPQGRYQFQTIRPAPYPNDTIPAHVHPVVKEPGKNEYYLDEYVFDDDPLLTPQKRKEMENRGGSGVIVLTKNSRGTWIGKRDVVLGRNIPGYH